jgi:UrcA family protein
MNIAKSIRRSSFWSAALTSVACLVGATQASAADAPRSMTVSYRDLNLSTIEGATALYQRLRQAANSVCDERGTGLDRYQVWQACYRAAIADAVAKVNSPLLTSVHSGKSRSIVTAMNSK